LKFAYAILLIISTASPALAPPDLEYASEYEQAYWGALSPSAKGYWDHLK
jgi:hypothetical protein